MVKVKTRLKDWVGYIKVKVNIIVRVKVKKWIIVMIQDFGYVVWLLNYRINFYLWFAL